jgi:hypothetical protein
VPGRLRRFDPDDDWPGADVWEQLDAWTASREAWAEANGEWVESLTETLAAHEVVGPEPWKPDLV